jgi:glyoxylase-like metal-dependent hydrolase (beta-lactamase superfamily II)
MPTRTFEDRLSLAVGSTDVEAIHVNIHSDDAAVLWLPASGILLAGDTIEDTVTYVSAPEALDVHLADLARLAELGPRHVLPAHGDADMIGAGGYPPDVIAATQAYIRSLQRARDDAALRATPLRELLAEPLAAGVLTLHAPYEAVHKQNLERVFDA